MKVILNNLGNFKERPKKNEEVTKILKIIKHPDLISITFSKGKKGNNVNWIMGINILVIVCVMSVLKQEQSICKFMEIHQQPGTALYYACIPNVFLQF